MHTLIITEKPNVAERIANAIGSPQKQRRKGINYYEVDGTFVAPAVGHIFTLAEKKKGPWRYPVFDIEWVPSYTANKSSEFTRNYLENIEFLAKECDDFINACDYDIEGETIGFNVINHACKQDPLGKNVKRMRFSTLTKDAILDAYGKLEPTHKGMADAGLTRHILDWYWGINLSRALTLAIRRAKGYTTLSIGRVQGPTLKILAERDKKINAFNPEKYWELWMLASKEKDKVKALHKEEKFWDEEKAKKAKENCGKTAVVAEVKKSQFKQLPPVPFDLTTLQTEAYKHLKISPKRTLEVAQELYTNALISYPRTSSQVLPLAINYKTIMKKLTRIPQYKELVNSLLEKKKLKPHNGKKKDAAHPAIHPTGEIPRALHGEVGKVYDLILRRFLATFGDDAKRETVKVELDNNSEIFIAKGTRTVEKGWHVYYGPYAKFEEEELPELHKGDVLQVDKMTLDGKETKPPKRYTPASIIRRMEKSNIGTKATRSQILDILFRRNYLKGKSIEVTPLGMGVADTLDKFCPEVLSEKLTRKFEHDMEQIEAGKVESQKVMDDGRDALTKICKEFAGKEGEIGVSLARALREKRDESLGKCLKCEGSLVLRKSRFGGYFVGCNNYPECRCTISLPKGNIKIAGECKECGYAILTTFGRGKPFRFCINPECPSKKRG